MKERDHYSNKGGHRERSNFWKEVKDTARLLGRTFFYSPRLVPIEQAYLMRRQMFRDTRDGR